MMDFIHTWFTTGTLSDKIAITSSIIAIFAVIVGPLISVWIAYKQANSSIKIGYQQVVAPMRQKWITDLREHVSELVSVAVWFYRQGRDSDLDRNGDQEKYTLRFTQLMNEVELMLNLKEEKHRTLLSHLKEVRITSFWGNKRQQECEGHIAQMNICCAEVLKDEWRRTKNGD